MSTQISQRARLHMGLSVFLSPSMVDGEWRTGGNATVKTNSAPSLEPSAYLIDPKMKVRICRIHEYLVVIMRTKPLSHP